MPIGQLPTTKEVYEIFAQLYNPPTGTMAFMDSIANDVDWEVTGHQRYSGHWTSKQAYFDATWGKIGLLLAEPGYKLELPGKEDAVIGPDARGWAAIEMKTVDTKVKGGVAYLQHYTWLCKFDKNHKIVAAKAFLDTGHLEDVLGGEFRRQEAASKGVSV